MNKCIVVKTMLNSHWIQLILVRAKLRRVKPIVYDLGKIVWILKRGFHPILAT